MREIKTKFGVLYIEDAADRSEEDRIKLFDSRKRYFEYHSVEGYEESEVEELISKTVEDISKMQDVDELMDYFCISSYTVSNDWLGLLEDIYGADEYWYDEEVGKWVESDGDEITEATVLQNDFVNVVGDLLILVCDY